MKHLATADGKDFATTEQVHVRTVTDLVMYHHDEFEDSGYRVLRAEELRSFKEDSTRNFRVNLKARGHWRFGTAGAVLLLGMLLRSEVAMG